VRIVISNPFGKLPDGRELVLFPSRCDWIGTGRTFAYYPYELAYLSTLLKRELPQHEIVFTDPNLEGLTPWETYERLAALEPDVLITECGHLTYKHMSAILAELRTQRPLQAYLTGPFATSFPEQVFDDGWAPIAGEYEYQVLLALEGAAVNKRIHAGPINLDWLPWPEDQAVSRIDYWECNNPYPGMAQVYPTRGCPLSCSFCTAPIYYGGHGASHKSHRTRDPKNVCDEIEYLAKKYEGRFSGCFFNEEAHNADVNWLVKFAGELLLRGLDRYAYDAMCGYWTMTGSLIELLAKAGYKQLRMGVESFSPEVGRQIHKRVFPEKLTQVLQDCKANGIRTYITCMVGAPGSTAGSDQATLNALAELKVKDLLDVVQHSTATPNPGTAFWSQAIEEGWLQDADQDGYHWKHPVISYPDYPAEEIGRMNQAFYQLRRL
jgi:radical SAM superfamily enzyme YgiQ (UPF0313 family)